MHIKGHLASAYKPSRCSLLEFIGMPFGLVDAALTFQRFLDPVLYGLFCTVTHTLTSRLPVVI